MTLIKRAYFRFKALLFGASKRQDLEDEMQSHLEMRIEEHMSLGMNSEEARNTALREFGGVEQIKEECIDSWGVRMISNLIQDLQFSFRHMWKYKGLVTMVLLTLTVCIGATSAIFSFVNGVLIKPLPYGNPDHIVYIKEDRLNNDKDILWYISWPNFLDWREQNDVFKYMGAYSDEGFIITDGDEPEFAPGLSVSDGLFETFGVKPLLGRTFTADDITLIEDKLAIISYDLWQRRYLGDTDIIGKVINLNGHLQTIIGVLPPNFNYPFNAQIYIPFGSAYSWMNNRESSGLEVIAQLKPGVTLEQAQVEMDVITERLEQTYPDANTGVRVSLSFLTDLVTGDYKKILTTLLGTVGCVLLIACANVSNLLLAHTTKRRREIVTRMALGARKNRIIRQLLTESLLIGFIGAILGLVTSFWGVKAIIAMIPVELPYWMDFSLDNRVIAFTIFISLVTGTICGLTPALKASRLNLNSSLKEDGRVSSHSNIRVYNLLIVSEIALSIILLAGAGLIIKSYHQLKNTDTGFITDNILTFRLSLTSNIYSEQSIRVITFEDIRSKIEKLPGVVSAGAVFPRPYGGEGSWSYFLDIEGRPPYRKGEAPLVYNRKIIPGYFKTMGIPLLKGSYFTEIDTMGTNPVTLINETFAKKYFDEVDPINQRINIGGDFATVIGVVGDVIHSSTGFNPQLVMYDPNTHNFSNYMDYVVRTDIPPLNQVSAIQAVINETYPNLPVEGMTTMAEVASNSIWRERLYTFSLAILAFIALFLATIGTYAVIEYTVSQNTKDIGIRMALGAERFDVLWRVLRYGLKLTCIGLGIGLIGAFFLSQVIESLLFEVTPTDPWVYALVIITLVGAAIVASLIPALKATRIDPLLALRYE